MRVDRPIAEETKAYIERNFPCEPPCSSLGVCDNCCEKTVFLAGYNHGYRAGKSSYDELKVVEMSQPREWTLILNDKDELMGLSNLPIPEEGFPLQFHVIDNAAYDELKAALEIVRSCGRCGHCRLLVTEVLKAHS